MVTILVLCTGNSARSIIGEVLLRDMGAGRIASFSAGSQPKGQPHPAALALLAARGHAVDGLSSKSWDAFTGPDAPVINVAITVCDNAAGETCPIFPGAPVKAHWGIADPAAVEGEGQMAAFEQAYSEMTARIAALLALPLEDMTPVDMRDELNRIGLMEGATHG
jgi:arsenate reductase